MLLLQLYSVSIIKYLLYYGLILTIAVRVVFQVLDSYTMTDLKRFFNFLATFQ